MPSVLFINRVYPPGNGATGELLAELAEALVRRGWRVTVVASRPPGVMSAREERNGVNIEWVGGAPFTRRSHLRRALSYLSLYPAMFWRALRVPRVGCMVTLTDPPLVLVLGPLLGWLKGARVFHWAQDIYPELAESLGVLKAHGAWAGLLRCLSTAALRRCRLIVAVGSCMKDRLTKRGISAERIDVLPNWSNPERIRPQPLEGNSFRAGAGLEGKFVAMYSGNIGLAHTFDAVLDAAERLRDTSPEIVILVVGEGPRLPWIREQVAARKLDNVRLLAPVPRERLPSSLAAGDIHLITMREDLAGLVVPSKLYAVLAAGRPAIFIGPRASEAAQVLLRHRCGAVLPEATGAELAGCLLKWSVERGELAAAGVRALGAAAGSGPEEAASAFERVLRA